MTSLPAPLGRGVPTLVALALAGVLVGCSSPASPGAPATPASSASATASGSPAGSGSPASASPVRTPSATGPASPASSGGAVRRTPSPDPSSAGPLNAGTVPRTILTFRADDQAQAAEGEFNPNGTFVHQVNAADASLGALPGCGSSSATPPRARYALAASYRDAGSKQVGNVIQLRFASSRDAGAWFAEFVRQVKACPRVDLAPVVSADTVRDRRTSIGVVWSEAGVRRDETVTLAALQGRHDTAKVLAALG